MAPLLWLDHLLNAYAQPEFEHVVVDEAQEVSPLELYLLKIHSRNGWFTILGDLRQRMVPFKGISSWRELKAVFEADYPVPFVSRSSYRQTNEITRFSNRVLRRVLGATPPPLPFTRHGVPPRLSKSKSAGDMYRNIAERAKDALAQGLTVGVLTRTTRDAKVAAEKLFSLGVSAARHLEPDGEIQTNVTVSPILLSKGLEFDLVVIVGVDSQSFTGSDMDNRLIYLACTRARHILELHYFGTLSELLVDVGAIGVELGGDLEGKKGKRSIFKRLMGR
jgi:DNA helicase-2/ATP-dependent DNA helicase PcrA